MFSSSFVVRVNIIVEILNFSKFKTFKTYCYFQIFTFENSFFSQKSLKISKIRHNGH